MEDGMYDEQFWSKVQKYFLFAIFLFFVLYFTVAGVRHCTSRNASGNSDYDPAAGLGSVSTGLGGVEGGLRETERGLSELATELRSASAEAGTVRDAVRDARVQAAAIGGDLGGIGAAAKDIDRAIDGIERFIAETNRANNFP
jgi:hypothetical protein